MKTHYHVGFNTPTCPPEIEPYRVDTLGAARAAVIKEKRRIIDDMADGNDWPAWHSVGSARSGNVYVNRIDDPCIGVHIWYLPCEGCD